MVATILGFLDWKDIMKARVCRSWRDAALHTIVPPSEVGKSFWDGGDFDPPVHKFIPEFDVCSMDAFEGLEVLVNALPGLQQIRLGPFHGKVTRYGVSSHGYLDRRDTAEAKYEDGEDPNMNNLEDTRDFVSCDVGIIAHFSQLSNLVIDEAPLNGRYPVLLSLTQLRELSICDTPNLKFTLDMISNFRVLESFICKNNDSVSGDIKSLTALKSSLHEIVVEGCDGIKGDFMQLADFPALRNVDF